METVSIILDALNQYSSLLLVIITTVYVVLTFFLVKSTNMAIVFQRRPLITVNMSDYNVKIKNSGDMPALKISVGVLANVEGKEKDLGTYPFTIPQLNPGEEGNFSIENRYVDFLKELGLTRQRCMQDMFFDRGSLYFDDIKRDIRSKITIKILFYSDANPKQGLMDERVFSFDLRIYEPYSDDRGHVWCPGEEQRLNYDIEVGAEWVNGCNEYIKGT